MNFRLWVLAEIVALKKAFIYAELLKFKGDDCSQAAFVNLLNKNWLPAKFVKGK